MQKISNSTATATPAGEFTEGSPAGGIPSTLIKAAWLTTIQRELIALIQAAGLTLDVENDAQVLAAVQVLVSAGAANKQPLDATLTALASLGTAANQMIYSTGPDAFAVTTLSAFIRTLLDDADAATARATLGAQVSDATLTALAGVVTAANQLIYATGADTFATTALSAFIRTLLDDADAATARATLGAQASDATLTALAGVVTAANQLIYATDTDTFAATALSAFARSLLDDADAATALATLGAQPANTVLGSGQTWQNVTASRASGVTYTNSTSKPIEVMTVVSGTPYQVYSVYVGGVAIGSSNSGGAAYSQAGNVSFIVPAGATYSISISTGALTTWFELR